MKPKHSSYWIFLGLLAAWVTGSACPAWAQQARSSDVPPSEPPRRGEISLAPAPSVLVGIEAYAGLATLIMDDKALGRAQAGALVRLRLSHLEFSGLAEWSDRDFTRTKWRLFGGSVGAYLPFYNWVDIDASVGLGSRTYVNLDTRYGEAGAHVPIPTLLMRVGFSNRLTGGIAAPRLGGSLFSTVDLSRTKTHWEYRSEASVISEGDTQFGGTTVGLLATFGFDVAPLARDPAPQAPRPEKPGQSD